MRRLDMLARMTNAKSLMKTEEKQAVIDLFEQIESQSKQYFDDLKEEVNYKARGGLDIIQTFNDLSDQIENRWTGWNGLLAIIMASWFFIDCIAELGARRWISRKHEKLYVSQLYTNLYARLRSNTWDMIRSENWDSLMRFITRLQTESSRANTILIIASIATLTLLRLKYPRYDFTVYEISL